MNTLKFKHFIVFTDFLYLFSDKNNKNSNIIIHFKSNNLYNEFVSSLKPVHSVLGFHPLLCCLFRVCEQ